MPEKQNIPEYKLRKKGTEEVPFKIEELEANVGYNPMAPHRHNYYEIFLFCKSGGKHMVDFHEMEIIENHLHILSPGQVHYMHRHPETTGWVIKFSSEFFLGNLSDKTILNRIPFLNNKVDYPVIKPSPSDFNYLLEMVNNIRDEMAHKRSGYLDMVQNYLNLILLKCHRLFDYTQQNEKSEELNLTNLFKTLLEAHYISENRVSFYCEKLKSTPEKLNHAIKLVTGKTASDLISERLLLESKRLLLHSDQSMKEIAFGLNFHDNSYFNRWFKKLTDLSPGDFRKVYREKYQA
ncbi:MAG: helix-turn-helix domain-containing protein [Flavobacteriales bacterium]|nr:helix-turn-helix domain-containing protein [Flavobacteriales bacterium]